MPEDHLAREQLGAGERGRHGAGDADLAVKQVGDGEDHVGRQGVGVGEAEVRRAEHHAAAFVDRRLQSARQRRRIVDRQHVDRDGVGRGAPAGIARGHGERVRAVDVGGAEIGERRERVGDLGLRAGQRQRTAGVGAGVDRRAAIEVDRQRAVVDGERYRTQVAVDIRHRQAGDRQRHVFGGRLRPGHGVDRRDVAVEQALPARGIAAGEQRARLDGAGGELERPVATDGGAAGRIVARRDVGTGQRCQPLEQRDARGIRCQAAAVQQQVGLLGERAAPGADRLVRGVERGCIDAPPAQRQLAGLAVGEHVHRAHVVHRRQRLADLREAVAVGIEQDDPQARLRTLRGDRVDQGLRVGHAGIDHHQLDRTHGGHRERRRGRGGRVGVGGTHDLRLGHRHRRRAREQVGGVEDPRLDTFRACAGSRRRAAVDPIEPAGQHGDPLSAWESQPGSRGRTDRTSGCRPASRRPPDGAGWARAGRPARSPA